MGWRKGRDGVGKENAESKEQSDNKVKTMSNMETIKINHTILLKVEKTEKMSTYPQSTKEK